MSGPASRRGFLRDLAGLPLLGGGLAIIGAPTAVAIPVHNGLLRSYETWLIDELKRLVAETRPGITPFYQSGILDEPAYEFHYPRLGASPLPSTRAALVLSTVGCGWGRAW